MNETLRETVAAFRRVQVHDGDGDAVLDVLTVSSVEADWLRDFLEGTDAGDVYVDPVPVLRLPAAIRAALASEAAPASGEGLREGDDDGSTLNERLSDVATGTVTGMTDRRIERIVRDADYALRALERGDIDNARAALRRGFQRAPVGLRASTATPPEPGLDVERLARAIASVEANAGPVAADIDIAREYAAEYARLSASPIQEPEEHPE